MFRITDIYKSYGQKKVLMGASLEAEPGQCIGILGANGCGKSTLLNILSGLLKADSGSIEWNGHDLLRDKKLRSQIEGYVPQGMPLFPELSGLDNLKLWYRGSRGELEEDLSSGLLSVLGIEEFLNVPVAKMSEGMKKKLCIACAMGHHPAILLLDEPSTALDLVSKEHIYHYLDDFRGEGGTVFLVTHTPEEISICDQCYLLEQGKLIPYQYDGNIHQLAERLGKQ